MKIERERDKDIRKKQGKGRAKRISREKKNPLHKTTEEGAMYS